MTSLPTNLYSVESVRQIDSLTIAAGTAGYTLMKQAGADAFQLAIKTWPHARRWQVLCGAGNNAGDGYVVARLAMSAGIEVAVISMVKPDRLQGDAATAYADFIKAGGTVQAWPQPLAADADVLIDAVLGRSALRDVDGDFAASIAAINDHKAPTLALDIPSGLDGDSGAIRGCAVLAEMTIAFVALSPGLFAGDARDCVGDLHFSALDIAPTTVASQTPILRRVSAAMRRRLLPVRHRNAHKGDFGHILVVGGGPGMPGAARLCGEAALRAGAGRVSVATHPSHTAVICAARPELMVHAIDSPDALTRLLATADVLAFGPGLGRSEWAQSLFDAAKVHEGPSVWDADALNWLADQPFANASRVITPHPGEAATLLRTSAQAIQSDRGAGLLSLQQQYGGTVVLKGAGTRVSAAAGVPWLETAGNPGMSAPGMGDVLTGIIAALLGQGLTSEEAAAVGVSLHARAGDRAASGGERGLMASDVLECVRDEVNPAMRADKRSDLRASNGPSR